jgi:hypothetical protein
VKIQRLDIIRFVRRSGSPVIVIIAIFPSSEQIFACVGGDPFLQIIICLFGQRLITFLEYMLLGLREFSSVSIV